MEHIFKNRIRIFIPDELADPLEEWNHVKVIMSILLGTPSKGKEVKLRPDGRKKNKKTWKSPKKK